MYRKALIQLEEWKTSPRRKPLVLRGARQVGKTWTMQEFGARNYEQTFYFSFDKETELSGIFEANKDPHRLMELLGMIRGSKIEAGRHLVIFDEVQECPAALGSLKYFCEEANEFHIIAAGSLLGTLLAQPMSYPVGKVNVMDMYPMDFEEFLGEVNPSLLTYIQEIPPEEIIPIQHTKLVEQYHTYLIVGGMPECVANWSQERNAGTVLQIQKELLALYENDFAKHNSRVNAARILLVFRSIVSQLAKENEKFVYGRIRHGARAREFEEAIEWLVSSGLVMRVYDVTKPEAPLRAFENLSSFKLFFFDTGLLKCMAGVQNQQIVLDGDFQFKGALAENYICQQLRGLFETEAHYYSPCQNYEVDFLLQTQTEVIPVECKGGRNVAGASFKRYIRENAPSTAVRFSLLPYKQQQSMVNVPLYLARTFFAKR